MSCCAPGAELALATTDPHIADEELLLASHIVGDGINQTDLYVPSVHCGGCVQKIESALGALPDVEQAHVNLSTKRVWIRWRTAIPPPLIETLENIGYHAHLNNPDTDGKDETLTELIRALAVSGFAASSIVGFSLAIWIGAKPSTRVMLHWMSALIACPVLIYSGHVFFQSAWRSLRRGETNMDVPISIGVLLAFGMSLYETINHGVHAYFDASISLLFFLLIGRTIDYMMRERARNTVKGLACLASRGALVLQEDGKRLYLPVEEIQPGMTLLLSVGERVPVDVIVMQGTSEINDALVSGESVPQPIVAGDRLSAGMLNLTEPLTVAAIAAVKDSFLAEMMRMMETAESGCSEHPRIAGCAARLYAPLVHLTALLTFSGWMIATGDAHLSITIAIAVLIITCPCVLSFAVPMVQIAAARRLFEQGVMIKDRGALERLAEIDTVVFDKTGALTMDRIRRADLARNDNASQDHAKLPTGVALSENGQPRCAFRFDNRLRPDMRQSIDEIAFQGYRVEFMSGDRDEPMRRLANVLNVSYLAGVSPAGKTARIRELTALGHRVLMVGSGLDDSQALAAAHASIAPASAADVSRNTADLVFLRDSLMAVPLAISVARNARHLVRQNLALAIGYNMITVPIAVLGYVTPLIAAVAMSASSLIVIANALRLTGSRLKGNTHKGRFPANPLLHKLWVKQTP